MSNYPLSDREIEEFIRVFGRDRAEAALSPERMMRFDSMRVTEPGVKSQLTLDAPSFPNLCLAREAHERTT